MATPHVSRQKIYDYDNMQYEIMSVAVDILEHLKECEHVERYGSEGAAIREEAVPISIVAEGLTIVIYYHYPSIRKLECVKVSVEAFVKNSKWAEEEMLKAKMEYGKL